MPRLTILSPHLDDAALGCADHALAWLRQGHRVDVVNVFTCLGQDAVSPYVEPFMRAVGCDSPAAYESLRKQEDAEAMAALGLAWRNLEFVDAGFRGGPSGPDYRNRRELCPGKLGGRERDLAERVAGALRALSLEGAVAVPLGVGGHIDHLIVRAAALAVWESPRIVDYVEFPYALRPWKWRWDTARRVLGSRRSWLPISPRKIEALGRYRTQMPFLFKGGRPLYPEILLSDPAGPLGREFGLDRPPGA